MAELESDRKEVERGGSRGNVHSATVTEAELHAQKHAASRTKSLVVVSGDVTLDTYIALSETKKNVHTIKNLAEQPGAAFHLHELLHLLQGANVVGCYQQSAARTPKKVSLGPVDFTIDENKYVCGSRGRDVDTATKGIHIHRESYFRVKRFPQTTIPFGEDNADRVLVDLRRAMVDDWYEWRTRTPGRDKATDIDRARKALSVGAWRVDEVAGSGSKEPTNTRATNQSGRNQDPDSEVDRGQGGTTNIASPACPNIQLLVIEDNGFGYHEAHSLHDDLLGVDPENIILKYTFRDDDREYSADADGSQRAHEDLVSKISKQNAIGTKVLILKIEDIRAAGLRVGSETSWELCCTDLLRNIQRPYTRLATRLHDLINGFDHTLFVFHNSACLLRSCRRGEKEVEAEYRLLYDQRFTEGQWERQFGGSVLGVASTITAVMAWKLAESPRLTSEQKSPQMFELRGGILFDSVKLGLAAARFIHVAGMSDDQPVDDNNTTLEYPYAQVVEALHGGTFANKHSDSNKRFRLLRTYADKLCDCTLDPRVTVDDSSGWTILGRKYGQSSSQLERASQIVKYGLKALEAVPYQQIGSLVVVDRKEIEAINGLRYLINNYLANPGRRPLCLAVFGQPGSGKSLIVREIATEINQENQEKERVEIIEFNMTQFHSPDDLHSALQQTRDRPIGKKVPMVVWDEFDCSVDREEFYWLKHFLMPMEDGMFVQHQLRHPVGDAIFIFTGGTCRSYGDFIERGRDISPNLKMTDFVSRLGGHLNVLGPNFNDKDQIGSVFAAQIRRALFLHYFLKAIFRTELCDADGGVHVDDHVINAFLCTPDFSHGMRSLKTIIMMSNFEQARSVSSSSLPQTFGPSNLPPATQLEGHVNVNEFMDYVWGRVSP